MVSLFIFVNNANRWSPVFVITLYLTESKDLKFSRIFQILHNNTTPLVYDKYSCKEKNNHFSFFFLQPKICTMHLRQIYEAAFGLDPCLCPGFEV